MSPQMAKAYRRMAEVNRVVSPIEGEDTSTMVPGSIPTEAFRLKNISRVYAPSGPAWPRRPMPGVGPVPNMEREPWARHDPERPSQLSSAFLSERDDFGLGDCQQKISLGCGQSRNGWDVYSHCRATSSRNFHPVAA
jgi:hypothetical protein